MSGWHIWPWMIQHAAWVLRTYSMGSDGRTPEERRRGRRTEKPMVAFGESVWYMASHTAPRSKEDARWHEVIILVRIDDSCEYIICPPQGIVRTP